MNINWKIILVQSFTVVMTAGIVTMPTTSAFAAPADEAFVALKAGNNKGAITLFEQALKSDPNNAILRTNLAYTFLKMDQKQLALSELLTVVKQNPANT